MFTDVIIRDRKTNKGPNERGGDSEMSFARFLKDKWNSSKQSYQGGSSG